MIETERNIFGDGEMREEGVILQEQTDGGDRGWEPCTPFFNGPEDAIVEDDAVGVGALQTGDAAERHCLAGAGGAEDGAPVLRRWRRLALEIVVGEALFDLRFQPHICEPRPNSRA